MARSFTAVVGPAARRGLARLMPVAQLLRAGGARVRVEYTGGVGQAREVARRCAADGETVLAAGGDGTLRCLGAALAGTDGVLGVVPAGRGNDLARQLGLPSRPEEVASLLLHGEPRRADVLDAGGEIVLGSVYAGVDAAANERANQARFTPAGLVYPLAAARALVGWRPTVYRLTVDGERLTPVRAYSVVVANSGYYGGGLHVAPDAAVDDGLLDVIVLGDASKMLFPLILREMRTGAHVRRPEVTVLRGTTVTVATDRRVPAYADGDPLTVLGELRIRALPAALSILAPTLP
ncbi:diacylglycerol/lipid kinase family protein [Catellatospora sichuanensis]|uniref:diacylglycerol/lipid kinase family protein n=1 Tax=Catellatospora sichuanensis TaxID=1969805 RepID=UPI001181D88D|nr:diacylglycerol kinase family protein [Catellatospora sichuanensis]